MTKKNIKNYCDEFKNGKIPKDALNCQIIDHQATINTLMWVLDEK